MFIELTHFFQVPTVCISLYSVFPRHKSFKLLSLSFVYIAYSFFPGFSLFNLIYGMPRGQGECVLCFQIGTERGERLLQTAQMESLQSYRWHCLSGQTAGNATSVVIDNATLFALFLVLPFLSLG